MLEELRENVLGLLEERVERAIQLINRLRQEKNELTSQVSELRDELNLRDARIQDIETQNVELRRSEAELKELKEKQELERQEVDREKAEIRERLEGVMTLLNGVNPKPEEAENEDAEEPTIIEETPTAEESSTTATVREEVGE